MNDKSASPYETALSATKRLLIHAGVLSFFVNILMLTGPLYMLQIYDRVLSSRSYETLLVISLLTLGLFSAMALLDFARGALLARAGDEFEKRLNETTFDLSIEASLHGAASSDQPLKDLRRVRHFIASPALTAVFDAPWTPFFLAIIFLMHWLLGLVALVGLLVLLCLAALNERISRKATSSAQSAATKGDKFTNAILRNAASTEAMGMRSALKRRWVAVNNAGNLQSLTATDRIGGLTATTKATRLYLQSAILGAGAYLAINAEVTPGVMIAASIIAGRALAPIEVVTGQWRNFALSLEAFKRLTAFVSQAGSPAAKTTLLDPEGNISAVRIFCRPGASKKPVLKDISFSLNAGESLGVIGPSAAGKSTLARTLIGVERLMSGDIRIDGANIDHWDSDALGKHLGYLPQDVELFSGTAAENIARFSDHANAEDIIAAAKNAGVHDMILEFPEGYDTEIGEQGRHLSAGQRQRLGLARALYGEPVFVVLDEPNANLDADGDAALADALQTLRARKATTVIIAHRPTAIASVDKLLLLVDGQVRAFGPRDEVLQKITPKSVTPFVNAKANRAKDVQTTQQS